MLKVINNPFRRVQQKPLQYNYKDILLKTDTDDELVSNIDMKVKKWYHESYEIRRQNIINASFARSNQWSVLRKRSDQLIALPEVGSRRKITDDMIGPWKEHTIANMTTALPEFDVVPDGERSSLSVTASRMGTDLLMYYWYAWKFLE